jgi:hypothetical protein
MRTRTTSATSESTCVHALAGSRSARIAIGPFSPRPLSTSRTVRAHPLTDFWRRGLNYQIERHLFPTLPRNHCGAAQVRVKVCCAARDSTYHETWRSANPSATLWLCRAPAWTPLVGHGIRQVRRVTLKPWSTDARRLAANRTLPCGLAS